MKHYPKDPYRTTAKFDSVCSICGKQIKTNEPIVYDKYRRLVYCMNEKCGIDIIRNIQAEKSYDNYGTDIY